MSVKIKIFRFEKDAVETEIQFAIDHWLQVSNAKIINLICVAPTSFDRYLTYNVIYEQEGSERYE